MRIHLSFSEDELDFLVHVLSTYLRVEQAGFVVPESRGKVSEMVLKIKKALKEMEV